MATSSLPIDEFVEFIQTLEGHVLTTRAGRSRFTVRVVDTGLEFTPLSTGTARSHRRAYIQRVIDQFLRTDSWSTSDYRFTVNASYQLTLIELYLEHAREFSRR
jgi:hypothetical protein